MKKKIINLIFLLITESCQGPHEKRLLNHLLSTYNTLERPVANESEPLEVKFGLTLQQIIDVVSFCVTTNSLKKSFFITFYGDLKLWNKRSIEKKKQKKKETEIPFNQ